MAIIRKSNAELGRGYVNHRKLKKTTEADIERYKQEDGIDDRFLGPAHLVIPGPDVRSIREKLGLTQRDFARRFCLSERTVQQWEQSKSVPDGPARILLRVIERAPDVVERALRNS